MLNKPVGVLSATKDDRGRETVTDLVRRHLPRKIQAFSAGKYVSK
jgi:16S rRNA U516 pseudouridylate synthase RsuA-like enzyme